MTSRKKPGMAFWGTVFVVVATAYVFSFGPAVWIAFRTGIGSDAIGLVYCPLCTLGVYHEGWGRPLMWYAALGVDVVRGPRRR